MTTLTVTVNSVDPEIQALISPKIAWRRKRVNGTEAGRRLIESQLTGVARATSLGLTIKINTVLIPTVNDHHIGEVAAAVAKAGARMINIIPLIPEHQLSHLRSRASSSGTRPAPPPRSTCGSSPTASAAAPTRSACPA